jgi:hypothetical protein
MGQNCPRNFSLEPGVADRHEPLRRFSPALSGTPVRRIRNQHANPAPLISAAQPLGKEVSIQTGG